MAEYKPPEAAPQAGYISRLKSWWDGEYGVPLVIAAALVGTMGFSLYYSQQRYTAELRQQFQPIERKLDKILIKGENTLADLDDALDETESVTYELEDVLQELRETLTESRKLAGESSPARVWGK